MNTYNSLSALATSNDMGCFTIEEPINTESMNTEMVDRLQVIGSKSFNNFAELMTASSQVVVDN